MSSLYSSVLISCKAGIDVCVYRNHNWLIRWTLHDDGTKQSTELLLCAVGAGKSAHYWTPSDDIGVHTAASRLHCGPDGQLALERNSETGARSTSSWELSSQRSSARRSHDAQVLSGSIVRDGQFHLHAQPLWVCPVCVRQRQHRPHVCHWYTRCLLRTDSQR